MNKELVPYQPSVDLKELGFNMKTFAQYSTKIGDEWIISFNVYGEGQFTGNEGPCIAPTFSQAFRFFREKYGLLSFIDMDNYSYYRFTIYEGKGISVAPHKTYEEAELECLKKLIKIVNEKK